MYAAFLKIRVPCIMSFFLCRLNFDFLQNSNICFMFKKTIVDKKQKKFHMLDINQIRLIRDINNISGLKNPVYS